MARGYRKWSTLVAIATGMALIPIGARALDTTDTRLLSTPAITEGKIAFAYADDIWVADADGSNPRRVTSHPGEEQNPYFSPDGKHIAFTASYDGNEDVYVIPTEGGEPTRLTWHPGEDIVRGFTPDGKVLFSSQRSVFSRRHAQFYTVGVAGGVPDRLPIPTAIKGAISPDGKYLAYTPLGENVPPVEELSRRHGLADLGPQARRPVARGGPQARRGLQRHRADVDRRDGLLPVGSRRGVQPVLLRSAIEDGRAMHPPRRLPDRQRLGRGRQGHLRASRLDSPLRPQGSRVAPAQDRGGRRPGRDPASLRQRRQAYPKRRDLAHRQAGRARISRRDRHHPGQEGRPSRPDRDPRRARTLARLVAGRQVDRVFLRRDRRIPVGRPPSGRQGRRPVLPAQGVRLLRAAGLVAR